MRRLAQRQRGSGQSLVEFALVLPLIVFMLFAVIDLGRAIYAYNTLAESARQANRVAIVDQTVATVRTQAISSAPAVGLTSGDVDVCFKTSGTLQRDCAAATDNCAAALRIGCLAIVTSRTTFQPITPVVGSIVGSISLSSTSIGPVEYVCPTATKLTCP